MNMKGDLLIRGNRNKRGKSNKRRNIIVASALSVVCVAAMAGIYRMESKNNSKEELLVNWEDNATSDTEDKVKVNIASEELAGGNSLEAEVSENETAQSIGDTSLLEADIQEADSLEEQDTSTDAAGETLGENPVGEDAVEVTEDSTEASADNSIALMFSPEDTLNWPVNGNVILDYSMDATTYFPTLDQYKYNPAMIIQSEVGTQVCAAASGTVESIVENDDTGITVTMDIGGGYQLIYGQLQSVDYGTGAYIEKGETVGKIAEPTKYYTVEGSNLYFKMLKNGVPTDPVNFLKEGIISE